MSDEPIGELGAARQLFSAVIGDVMDRLGMRHQFLPPEIRPLDEDTVLVGRAMPVEEVDIDPDDDLAPGSFGVMLQALDDLLERVKIDTRRFAKSQRTWLKRYRGVHWIEADHLTPQQIAKQAILAIDAQSQA